MRVKYLSLPIFSTIGFLETTTHYSLLNKRHIKTYIRIYKQSLLGLIYIILLYTCD